MTPHIFFLSALALVSSASADVTGNDIPAGLLETRQNLYLRGQPKTLHYELYRWGPDDNGREGYVRHHSIEQQFDRDGLLSVQKGKGVTVGAFQVTRSRKRIKRITRYSGDYGDNSRFTEINPLQYDGKDRITAYKQSYIIDNGSIRTEEQPSLVTVSYDDRMQIHATYINRRQVEKVIYKFADDGALQQRCSGDCMQEKSVTDYGPYGPVKTTMPGLVYDFEYENGLLMRNVTRNVAAGTTLGQVQYSGYKVDKCGNWVYRELVETDAAGGNGKGYESRSITYYEGC